MIRIIVLKSYRYRGAKIYIRQLDTSVFEFFIVYHNQAYTQHFILEDKAKSVKEKGGVTVILCQVAEGLVDQIKQKSLWHKLIGRFLPKTKFVKAGEEEQTNAI